MGHHLLTSILEQQYICDIVVVAINTTDNVLSWRTRRLIVNMLFSVTTELNYVKVNVFISQFFFSLVSLLVLCGCLFDEIEFLSLYIYIYIYICVIYILLYNHFSQPNGAMPFHYNHNNGWHAGTDNWFLMSS